MRAKKKDLLTRLEDHSWRSNVADTLVEWCMQREEAAAMIRELSTPAGAASVLLKEDMDAMITAGLRHYSEGGCMGLDDCERREVVAEIITAALRALAGQPPV